MYKMIDITKEAFENNDIEVIIDGVDTSWSNDRHIEKLFSHKNLPAITNKYDEIYKKTQMWISRWTNKTTKCKIFTYWLSIKNNNALYNR